MQECVEMMSGDESGFVRDMNIEIFEVELNLFIEQLAIAFHFLLSLRDFDEKLAKSVFKHAIELKYINETIKHIFVIIN